MKINLQNINTSSNSGPNSFAKKLIPELNHLGCSFVSPEQSELSLCFIETNHRSGKPLVQRLDGIYFNKDFDYNSQNRNIKSTYEHASGVIYQSNFNEKLISKYFGEHKHPIVIHNGANLLEISKSTPMKNDKYDNIWSCAASWRPHKRLTSNIKYFLEHSGPRDLLIVAGHVPESDKLIDEKIVYFGELSQSQLYSLYKSSTYFLHMAYLDHCPNVVVDARACGSHIICTDAGGTMEIAGLDATIIEEKDTWDFEPTRLYDPPPLDFTKKKKNQYDACYDMKVVATRYKEFMEKVNCQ
jgi:glycosyltransferase involved in cell wall biosynthesis